MEWGQAKDYSKTNTEVFVLHIHFKKNFKRRMVFCGYKSQNYGHKSNWY